MNATRYDALTARSYTTRDGEVKTAFTKIGTMWPTRNGGFRLILEALPLPALNDKGALETTIILKEPQERNNRPSGGAPAADDDIPF